jgi:pimeloyl-ACP methyl ester carboxylesterase
LWRGLTVPGLAERAAPGPEPFRFCASDADLHDLLIRVRSARLPHSIPGSAYAYGMDVDYMRELLAYWSDVFSWRERERALNGLRHFTMDVGGLRVHFIHERGEGETPCPLVLTHGWPGSFLEFRKLIPLLTHPSRYGENASDAFDVVVPSLPGYGFSEAARSPGMSNRRIAQLWAELMRALGYERFGAQGGDWGAGVSTWLARDFPERIIGVHLNYVPGSYTPSLGDTVLRPEERVFIEERDRWRASHGGYGQLQSTEPQTLAYALSDSPVGLAAWIIDKFRAWSDCGGDVERRFTKDELLENVTLYWLTHTIESSMRLYYESRATPLHFAPGERVNVPVGVAVFPLEAPRPPRSWVERAYNVTHWSEMESGGHFAALEEPEALASDIRTFFRPLMVGHRLG